MIRKIVSTSLIGFTSLSLALSSQFVAQGSAFAAPSPSPASSEMMMKEPGTIVDVAAGNGSFKTLVEAVKAAGLVETLSGKDPLTVFAPTDEAFAKLPKETLEALLKPENKEKLVQVLTYHVVPGVVMSSDIKPGMVKTVEGADIELKVDAAKKEVMVNNAKVVGADVKASNGVIHVIDTVILPPNFKL